MIPEDNITILILNGVKRIKIHKVNRKRIRIAIIGVSFFAVLFFFSISLNVYQLFYSNNANRATLPTEQNNNIQGGQSSETTKNEITSDNTDNTEKDDHTGSGQSPQLGTEDVFADRDSELMYLQYVNEELQSNKSELRISFFIYKKENIPQESVAGHFVIVAKTTDAENPYLSYPENIELNPDGTVTEQDTKKGERFRMSVQTPMKGGAIRLTDKTASFEYYRILIFSDTGELLLQKTRMMDSGSS